MQLWRYTKEDGVKDIDVLPALDKKILSIDIETSGLSIWNDTFTCIQVSDGSVSYGMTDPTPLLPYLTDPAYLKIFHYAQFDATWIRHKFGVMPVRFIDTMIAERVLNNGLSQSSGLGEITEKYTGQYLNKDIRNTFIGHIGPLTPQQQEYACKDVHWMNEIWAHQQLQLRSDGLIDTVRLEFDLMPVMIDMYIKGVGFDINRWHEVQEITRGKQTLALGELLSFFPHIKTGIDLMGNVYSDFNPASDKHLLRALRKHGVNLENVSEATLKQHLRDNPKNTWYRQFFMRLMEWRKLTSLANLDLESHINPKTGRIHGDINQLGARTGRLTMGRPNLQNQQATDELRSCFVARPGYMVVDCDLSQIELVVMAELSGDPNMMRAVLEGEDMHTATARLLFNTDNPTPEQRRIAKTANFAAIFGSGYNTFSLSAGISYSDAKKYLELYFQKYPTLEAYGDEQIALAKGHGYSVNVGGRRRYIDDMDRAMSGGLDSMFKNYPVQSTAADIIKKALIFVYLQGQKYGYDTILTVHDEILCEVREDMAEEIGTLMESEMSRAGGVYMKKLPVRAKKAIAKHWKK